jgi:hypothetical protein
MISIFNESKKRRIFRVFIKAENSLLSRDFLKKAA